MILKDYIILKLGQKNIASVLFSLDLVADIIIHICTGNLTRITGSLCIFFSIAAYNSSILCSAAVHAIRAYPLSSFCTAAYSFPEFFSIKYDCIISAPEMSNHYFNQILVIVISS